MRPCDQCRRPVENSVFVCAACTAYNEEHGLEPPVQVGLEDQLPDVPAGKRDYSYTILMLVFNVLLISIGALLGFAIFGNSGIVPCGILGGIMGGGFMLLSR